MDFACFDWDRGNHAKCQKHGVPIAVIEQSFLDGVMILPDGLFIRPICARYMHKKEVEHYEKSART